MCVGTTVRVTSVHAPIIKRAAPTRELTCPRGDRRLPSKTSDGYTCGMTTTPHEPNPDDIPPTKDDDERSDKVGDDNPDEVRDSERGGERAVQRTCRSGASGRRTRGRASWLHPLDLPEVMAVPRRVLLVGMMGAGKSTVCQALTKLTGWPCLDNDELVHEVSGLTTPDLLGAAGEGSQRRGPERRGL